MAWNSTSGAPQDGKGASAGTSHSRHSALNITQVLPAYQQVANQLRDLIVSGSLVAGDKLPSESDLTAIFSVSRSTVREALKVLATRGLTNTLRGTTGGTFVARMQHDQISEYLETSLGLMSSADDVTAAEMLEARELLEVPAARIAATRREDHHIVALQKALEHEASDRQEQQVPYRSAKFFEHKNFHGLVVAAAGNGLLGLMTDPVFRVLQTRFLKTDIPSTFWAKVDEDHNEIFAHIKIGDGSGAARAMQDHLIRLRSAYNDGNHKGLRSNDQ